jgi:hypothetical protein
MEIFAGGQMKIKAMKYNKLFSCIVTAYCFPASLLLSTTARCIYSTAKRSIISLSLTKDFQAVACFSTAFNSSKHEILNAELRISHRPAGILKLLRTV